MSKQNINSPLAETAQSPMAEAWGMFRRDHAAMAGLFVLLLVLIAGVAGRGKR